MKILIYIAITKAVTGIMLLIKGTVSSDTVIERYFCLLLGIPLEAITLYVLVRMLG